MLIWFKKYQQLLPFRTCFCIAYIVTHQQQSCQQHHSAEGCHDILKKISIYMTRSFWQKQSPNHISMVAWNVQQCIWGLQQNYNQISKRNRTSQWDVLLTMISYKYQTSGGGIHLHDITNNFHSLAIIHEWYCQHWKVWATWPFSTCQPRKMAKTRK